MIEELGEGVSGYEVGDRVLVGAITPCGQCRGCLSGHSAQCGHGEGYEALGGWRFGNTINGAQAEYLKVPNAQANLAKIPDELTDEQVVLLADIASTGFSGAESARIKIGDSVVVFAQGPIGLCATAGAKLMGAALIIGIDGDDHRLAMSKRMGADITLCCLTQRDRRPCQTQSTFNIPLISVVWPIANVKAATRQTNRSGIRSTWETSRCSSALSVTRSNSRKICCRRTRATRRKQASKPCLNRSPPQDAKMRSYSHHYQKIRSRFR